MTRKASLIPDLVKNDPWLEPFTDDINDRLHRLKIKKEEICHKYHSIANYASAHKFLGFNYDAVSKGWWYREWAPHANALYLVADFNNWDRQSNPLSKVKNGIWEVFLDDVNYEGKLGHLSAVKVHVVTDTRSIDRLPAYINYATQKEDSPDFTGRIWSPEEEFKWTDKNFTAEKIYREPYIYECHAGMAQEKEGIGTFVEFADILLPRIKNQGYNAIQMMAVQEHPYYGSFGYHVSNFFAPSSRFGTPDDLKYLVNKAHEMGIAVIMDIVHSHAVKNIAEGLNEFDGTDLYFHSGGKGEHSNWDSKLFDYGKEEVLQFLLSNTRYWIEEFHIDGYRYDGVTSMLYYHHGDHVTFDRYEKYFNDVDWDVLIYLQLANDLIKQLKPWSITIAEDMSGMPGLCRPVKEGGMGFDFRLAMGIPDYWIKILKHKSDDEWNMEQLWATLTNRRFGERTIAYCESHDQALVGDKSIAFWLMDKEMYEYMHVDHDSLIIDRGIALHKMIRLLTLALGGEGWLNFIGNEFGHPEWVDFPREGNNWSYQYARRQWQLAEDQQLKYKFLYRFGAAMVSTAKNNHLLSSLPARLLNIDQDNHTLIFERNNLVFIFNFSPNNSIADYRFQVPSNGPYQIVLNSDSKEYGGFDRVDDQMNYPVGNSSDGHLLSLYLPNRVAMVLKQIIK